MNPALLLPIGLAALAAVIVPLVIHVARRSEVRPTDFAALRWLRPRPRPRNQIRFDEWPLLIARLLLLTLVALWLARPVLFGAADRTAYVAVVPGALIQGVEGVNPNTAHWLAPGFPLVKTPRPASNGRSGELPLASLIRQLDADLPPGTTLSILAPGVIQGADAERPRLTRVIDWRIVAGSVPPRTVRETPRMPVSIRYDANHAGGVRYLKAAVQAWAPPGQVADLEVAEVGSAPPAAGRVLIWLASGTVPGDVIEAVANGATALVAADVVVPLGLGSGLGSAPGDRAVVWRDGLGRALVEAAPLGQGRLMRMVRPLTAQAMPELLEPDFPARLRAVFEGPSAAPSRVSAADYAPLVGPESGGATLSQAPTDVRPWLAVLIALVLLGERWLATSRRRGVWP